MGTRAITRADGVQVFVEEFVQVDPASGLPVDGTDSFTSVTITAATTDAAGNGWAAFPAQACRLLDIINNTGTTIEYRRGGAGLSIRIPSGGSRLVYLPTGNANAISVRRTDLSATQVTVEAEAFTD